MFSDSSLEYISSESTSSEYEIPGIRCIRRIRRNYSFSDELPDKLNKLRKDKAFCDVILRSGLRDVYAHRIILATVSDYFTLLFKYQGGFDNPVIVLDEHMITGDCLETIVSYAYSGEIAIYKRNVCDLLMAADYFDIPFIRSECEKFLNESDIINYHNVSNLIWMVCHYNLPTFLESICNFVSNHFAEISETVLLKISPYCLLTLLKEKDLTVLYNGMPANHVEFELLKLITNYVNKYDLSDNSINDLLQVIQLYELTSDEFWSVLESSPRLSNNEWMIRVSHLRVLPSFAEEDYDMHSHSGGRKFSRVFKYIDGIEAGEELSIELDDRIKAITIYTLTGIQPAKSMKSKMKMKPYFNVWHLATLYSDKWEDEDFLSIIGISLTYNSGKKVKMGKTSAVFPLDVVSSRKFTLHDNDVIVKIRMAVKGGLLKSIEFQTSFGNTIGESMGEMDSYSYNASPKRKYGYFHSFGKNSTIDSLKFLWVEYLDPKLRQNQKYYHNDSYYDYDSASSGY